MSRNSMRGESQEKLVSAVLGRVERNIAFLTQEDIKILEHMSIKGDFDDKKAILVDRV